eukprot:15832104-Heterocapsa_arctica.AAC.1
MPSLFFVFAVLGQSAPASLPRLRVLDLLSSRGAPLSRRSCAVGCAVSAPAQHAALRGSAA